MRIRLGIDGGELLGALAKAPQVLAVERRRGMKEAGEVVVKEARQRHKFTTRAGFLERSVDSTVNASGTRLVVFLNERVARYGPFIHDGTGVYGPNGTPIRPRAGNKVLRFFSESRGRWVSKHEIRGIKPDPFLYRAFASSRKRVVGILERALARGIRRAGL